MNSYPSANQLSNPLFNSLSYPLINIYYNPMNNLPYQNYLDGYYDIYGNYFTYHPGIFSHSPVINMYYYGILNESNESEPMEIDEPDFINMNKFKNRNNYENKRNNNNYIGKNLSEKNKNKNKNINLEKKYKNVFNIF